MGRHAPFSRRGEQAIQAFQEADHLDATPRLSQGDDIVYSLEAKRARAKGDLLLEPVLPVTVSAGEASPQHRAAVADPMRYRFAGPPLLAGAGAGGILSSILPSGPATEEAAMRERAES